MPATRSPDDLIQLQLTVSAPVPPKADLAANGAPAAEPETWDPTVPAYNPHLGHTPEPEPIGLSPAMAAEFADPGFEIESFLAEERGKSLLRFSTAGSVDDGKSTLIGRLLYDTRSVYEDQIRSIEGKGTTGAGVLDLALLTDGLRAEREQGITIDVAYRYFATARRKFIIADTPGHEQYTRNMATGASTADVAIVLVDARKGVLPQSRRHAYITSLLGVRHVIVAINKMDLVGYAESVFTGIRRDFLAFHAGIRFGDEDAGIAPELLFVPVSALAGDNVAHPSSAMRWYSGPTLLELLETIPVATEGLDAPFRMAVQRVVRPNQDFRGFAGQIASGVVRVGDTLLALPSGRASRVDRITTFDGDLDRAAAPLSVTLTLADELDISRGDLFSSPDQPAELASRFIASLVWMDAEPLELSRRYLLKHTSRTVQARVTRLLHGVDIASMEDRPATTLELNGIGLAQIEAGQPLAVDRYRANRITGSFVLIDAMTNATAAAGMIRSVQPRSQVHAAPNAAGPLSTAHGPISSAERSAAWGHAGAYVTVFGPPHLAEQLERSLLARKAVAVTCSAALAPELAAHGLLAITHQTADRVRITVRPNGAQIAEDVAAANPAELAEEILRITRTHHPATRSRRN